MFKIINNTGIPNEYDKKSSLKEKIIKFFHTKIMGYSPEFCEFMRSLEDIQVNKQSSDDIIIDESNEEMNKIGD